jgi:hypothetical protein
VPFTDLVHVRVPISVFNGNSCSDLNPWCPERSSDFSAAFRQLSKTRSAGPLHRLLNLLWLKVNSLTICILLEDFADPFGEIKCGEPGQEDLTYGYSDSDRLFRLSCTFSFMATLPAGFLGYTTLVPLLSADSFHIGWIPIRFSLGRCCIHSGLPDGFLVTSHFRFRRDSGLMQILILEKCDMISVSGVL